MRVSRLRLALEMVGMLELAVLVLLLAVGLLPNSSKYMILYMYAGACHHSSDLFRRWGIGR